MTKELRPEAGTISPAARKLAAELGIDPQSLAGSGAQGRVVLADIKKRQAVMEAVSGDSSGYGQKVAVSTSSTRRKTVKIRRLLAKRMEQAWRTIPHFYVSIKVDMTDVVGLYRGLGVTVNDFILAATSRALVDHPWVNASWDGEQGIAHEEINIAMATVTDRGMFYPVLPRCGSMNLQELSLCARQLSEKMLRDGGLDVVESGNATFTVANMGMLGVESFRAIITPPQAAVLAAGAIRGEVIVDGQGSPLVAPMLHLTLSADHRVLDGADAAEFLDTVKCNLEAPVILIDG